MREAPKAKKLTRWMYRGKSYGTKFSAFKQMAKEELLNEFGPVWDWAHELMFDEGPDDDILGEFSEEQRDDVNFRPWEDKFPLKPGTPPSYCKDGSVRRFDYQAYKEWLSKRAYELMKEHGVPR